MQFLLCVFVCILVVYCVGVWELLQYRWNVSTKRPPDSAEFGQTRIKCKYPFNVIRLCLCVRLMNAFLMPFCPEKLSHIHHYTQMVCASRSITQQ